MRAFIALTLIAVLVFPGCAPSVKVATRATPEAPVTDTDIRKAIGGIPLGKNVTVKTFSGARHTGKLRAVGDSAVTIEKPGAAAQYDTLGNKVWDGTPPTTVQVPYDAIRSVERPAGAASKVGFAVLITFGVMMLGGLLLYAAGGGT